MQLDSHKQGPGIADDPAVKVDAPGCNKHEGTEGEEGSILNGTEASSHRVGFKAYKNLTNDDADDFEVRDSG